MEKTEDKHEEFQEAEHYRMGEGQLVEILNTLKEAKVSFYLGEDGVYLYGGCSYFVRGKGSQSATNCNIGKLVHGSVVGKEYGLYLQTRGTMKGEKIHQIAPDLVDLLREYIY